MKLLHPLPTGRYTDGFGPERFVPGVGWQPPHRGLDIAAPSGTPILAAHDGVVRRKFKDVAGGNLIYLAGEGIETSYQHMIAPSPLREGQYIKAGTIVGYVGSTGYSNGPHLHFEVWLHGPAWGGGTAVDPLPFINNKTTPKPPAVVNNEEEDDGMYRPTVHVRTEGNFEATRAHPEIGKDLKPGQKRKDGNVTVFRGFEVTTNKAVAKAWARMHARGFGNETSRTNRADYVAIQKQAQRISVEALA